MHIIALEGIDGCGKSTLLDQLAQKFAGDERVVFLHTPVSPFREMRRTLDVGNKADTFWFYQASNSYLTKTMRHDRVYVLDRFLYSTYIAHHTDDNTVNELIRQSFALLRLPVPCKTYLVRVTLATSWQRIHQRAELTEAERLNLVAYGKLYDTYYNPQAIPIKNLLFQDLEIIANETPDDLRQNFDQIAGYIRTKLSSPATS